MHGHCDLFCFRTRRSPRRRRRRRKKKKNHLRIRMRMLRRNWSRMPKRLQLNMYDMVFDGVSHVGTNLHTRVQAVSDASSKLKWAIGLQSNLDQLPGPQLLYVIILLGCFKKTRAYMLNLSHFGSTRSDKYKESVRQDYDEKKSKCEATNIEWVYLFRIPGCNRDGTMTTFFMLLMMRRMEMIVVMMMMMMKMVRKMSGDHKSQLPLLSFVFFLLSNSRKLAAIFRRLWTPTRPRLLLNLTHVYPFLCMCACAPAFLCACLGECVQINHLLGHAGSSCSLWQSTQRLRSGLRAIES